MTVDLRHLFVSPVTSAGSSTLVQGPNWNEAHNLQQGPQALLGRSDSTPGQAATAEIQLDPTTMAFVGGKLAAIGGGGGGTGTVTAVSVISANGLAGTVANATTTPAISLGTTVTGVLKGNGTAISGAVAGTDYMTPANVQTALSIIPQNAQTGSYTAGAADAGMHLYHAVGAAAATYTIPANASVAYPLGTTLSFVNDSANAVTIAITSDTLVLSPGTTAGSRTLATGGVATALKVTSTRWLINGTGLT